MSDAHEEREEQQVETDTNSAIEDDEGFERIRKLVEETSRMKLEEDERRQTIQNYFKTLRDKINTSTHFLNKIKNDIQNVKFVLDEDRRKLHDANNADYVELNGKTDEEIDEEFKRLYGKLDELEQRVSASKNEVANADGDEESTDKRTFNEAMSDTVVALQEIHKSINK